MGVPGIEVARRDDGLPDSPERRCLVLWQAVLQQTIEDAETAAVATNTAFYRREAREFLSRPSRDRVLLFEFCGIDLAAFEERSLPRLRERWREADRRIAGKLARKAGGERLRGRSPIAYCDDTMRTALDSMTNIKKSLERSACVATVLQRIESMHR